MTSDKAPRPQPKSTKGEIKGFDSMSLADIQFMLGLVNTGKLKLEVPSGPAEVIKADDTD